MAKVEKSKHTKNVGEWSEVYALAYLLANGGAFAADKNLEIDNSIFYKIIEALFRKQSDGFDLSYRISDKKIAVLIDGTVKGYVPRRALTQLAASLHVDLLRPQEGMAFPLKTGDQILDLLMKKNVAAPSSTYNDIYLSLADVRTSSATPFVGFSIKSQLNAKSTLLNASGATNFIYEIIPVKKGRLYPMPNFGSQLKPDMQELVKRGYRLKFVRIDNEIHQKNMDLIDSKLAEYLATCLFETTQRRNGNFARIATSVFPDTDPKSDAALLKLKQYLGYVMLGMTPSKPWSGQPNDFGGLIVVKKSGDVLFYYLYNMAEFQEFLFNNLKFEYGSRARHKFGKPYVENGRTFIKLNLQLRFI